jgi:putative transposase
LFGVHGVKCGSPRITVELRDARWRVSKNTVAQLVAEQRLVARQRRRRRGTTRSGKRGWRAPDWSSVISLQPG